MVRMFWPMTRFSSNTSVHVFLRGLLIASVCEEEIQVMEVALGSVFPILLSSGTLIASDSLSANPHLSRIVHTLGVIWPLEGMPPAMRFISNFTPLTHTIEAMRCIVSRGSVLVFSTRNVFIEQASFRLVVGILPSLVRFPHGQCLDLCLLRSCRFSLRSSPITYDRVVFLMDTNLYQAFEIKSSYPPRWRKTIK